MTQIWRSISVSDNDLCATKLCTENCVQLLSPAELNYIEGWNKLWADSNSRRKITSFRGHLCLSGVPRSRAELYDYTCGIPLHNIRSSIPSFFHNPGASLSPKMVDSRPNNPDEKALIIDESKHKGFFSRRAAAKSADDAKNHDEKSHTQHGDVSTEEKPAERETSPVSFTELFRCAVVLQQEIHSWLHAARSYSTKFELFIDFIGLIAAVASGAAQVCVVYVVPQYLRAHNHPSSLSCPCSSEILPKSSSPSRKLFTRPTTMPLVLQIDFPLRQLTSVMRQACLRYTWCA